MAFPRDEKVPIPGLPEFLDSVGAVHRQGPSLFRQAARRIKGNGSEPRFVLAVGSRDKTRGVVSISCEYDQSGQSSMRLVLDEAMQRGMMENAQVRLWLGYGRNVRSYVPFFRGRIYEPRDSRSGRFSEATCYGIGTWLGERRLNTRVDLSGKTLKEAWDELVKRSLVSERRFSFDDWRSRRVDSELGSLGAETTIAEAMAAILDPYGFVHFDQMGGIYRGRKRPLVSGTLNRRLRVTLDEDDYPKDAFTFRNIGRNFYDAVTVFRRSDDYEGGGDSRSQNPRGMIMAEDGSMVPRGFYGSPADRQAMTRQGGPQKHREYAVYVRRKVANRTPYYLPPNRDYVEADFSGDQVDAEKLCEDLATGFSFGVGEFDLNLEGACVDFSLNDAFGVMQLEEVRGRNNRAGANRGDIHRVLYGCISRRVGLEIAPGVFNMNVSGDAAERSRRVVRRARPVRVGRRSSSAVRRGRTARAAGSWGSSDGPDSRTYEERR